jgi:cell division protein ZapA
MQAILLDINIADDYFKQMNRTDLLKEESVGKEKDLYDLKHELISTQIRLQNAESSVRRLEKEKEEISRRALMLETELKSLKDRRDRH